MKDFIVRLITRLDSGMTSDDIKKIEEQLNARGIHLKTVLDAKTTEQELQELIRQLQSVLKTNGLNIDTGNLLSSLKQVKEEINNAVSDVKNIRISADTDRKETGHPKPASPAPAEEQAERLQANAAEKDCEKASPSVPEADTKKNSIDWDAVASKAGELIQSAEKMAEEIREIDAAMNRLYKVTDASRKKYEDFLTSASNTAQESGRTITDVIEQTTNWAKLGYSLDDAANLAKTSSVYANIEDIDNGTAIANIADIMKGFNIEAENSIDIIDKLTVLEGQCALSGGKLGSSLSEAASALSLAGNDLDESLAMLAAMTEITQDVSESGNILKSLSTRLHEPDVKTGSASVDTALLAGRIASLTKTESRPDGISIFTDQTNETCKSTYQILKEISAVWDELDAKSRTGLLDVLAGDQSGDAVAALMSDMSQAEHALNSSINSSGAAMQEQERRMESLEAKTNRFEAAFQSLSQTVLDSDLLKGITDLGTAGIQAIDSLVNALTPLGTLGAGAGLFAGIKNAGK